MMTTHSEPHWIQIGPIDEIPRLGARVLHHLGGDIAIFRTADDGIFALGNRCPHRGGPLSEGIVYGQTVACPLHNWCMDLANGRAKAPDEGQVPTFATRIEQGQVWVNTEPRLPAEDAGKTQNEAKPDAAEPLPADAGGDLA